MWPKQNKQTQRERKALQRERRFNQQQTAKGIITLHTTRMHACKQHQPARFRAAPSLATRTS